MSLNMDLNFLEIRELALMKRIWKKVLLRC